ncbi:uncharacterized protein [Procambarus clarkii]|uniref:uncharacterized protein n=1 Tax=Procambarus clarkii TaxID=6728 RepID=UPI00374422D6
MQGSTEVACTSLITLDEAIGGETPVRDNLETPVGDVTENDVTRITRAAEENGVTRESSTLNTPLGGFYGEESQPKRSLWTTPTQRVGITGSHLFTLEEYRNQRLESSLNRYCELMETFPGSMEFYQLMIREQFLEACESSLRVKLKEQEIVSNLSMAKQADLWAGARRQVKGVKLHEKHHATGTGEGAKPKTGVSGEQGNSSNKHVHKCYNCGKPGHRAADCKTKPKSGYIAGGISDCPSPPSKKTGEREDAASAACSLPQSAGATDGVTGSDHTLTHLKNKVEKASCDVMEKEAKPLVEATATPLTAVTTRPQSNKPTRPEKTLKLGDIQGVSAKEFIDAQGSDPTLAQIRRYAEEKRVFQHQERKYWYLHHNGKLVRRVETPHDTWDQLVVPQEHRLAVFRLGHEALMGGHMGHAKTSARIQSMFYWPGITGEIQRYTRSCDTCQRTIDRGRVKPGKLQPFPIIDQLFKLVSIDLVGPIIPSATDGSKYILTMVDHATRYPEAAALKNIETSTVAEALVGFFSRLGILEWIHSDRGTQFTSEMMDQVRRLLTARVSLTTPYHAMGNGLVERFNGTLKKMLKRMCIEQPREWPRYINPLLFAYREVPQASTGFSPFELLYDRTVKGPLQVLRNLREGDDCTPETKTTYEYVIDLRERLENTCQLAREQLAKAKEYQKQTYDKKAEERKFSVGDKALLLLPTSRNKLLLQWKGPFTVVECSHSLNYVLNIDGARKKYHVNMLKRYEDPPVDVSTKPKKHIRCMTQVERGSGQTSATQGFEALSRPRPGVTSDHSACSKPDKIAPCDPVTEEIPHLPEENSLDEDPPCLAV